MSKKIGKKLLKFKNTNLQTTKNHIIQDNPTETLRLAHSVLDLMLEITLLASSEHGIDLNENCITGLVTMQCCALDAIKFEEQRVNQDYEKIAQELRP